MGVMNYVLEESGLIIKREELLEFFDERRILIQCAL